MKRRDFLKLGAQVGVAVNVLPVMMGGFPIRAIGRSPLRSALDAASSNNNILVIVQLAGGNDGLNCVVPYGDPLYVSNRPSLGLDKTTDSLLVLPDHNTLALHTNMTALASLYGNGAGTGGGQVAILQNVGYPSAVLSHFRGTDIWHTATDSNISATTGWVGRMLYGLNPNYPPATIPAGSQPLAIQFGSSLYNLFLSNNGGMGIAISQVPTTASQSVHNYDNISANPTIPELELEYVRVIQSETEIYAQSIVNRSVKSNSPSVTYPATNFAKQLSGVAQLIASGFSTKIYLVTLGGFDTHSNELSNQGKLLGEFSDAISAFQQDLEALKVADNVATMTYSEFGRRVKENGSGTDHGTAAPHFVIGTQVVSGIHGTDPNLKNLDSTGNLQFDPNYDFRNVYASAMSEWLGVDDASIQNILTQSSGVQYSTQTNWKHLGIFKTQGAGVAGSPDDSGLILMDNYPNPVSSETVIQYSLPQSMNIELGIFDLRGTEVARVANGMQEMGLHTSYFKADNLPSGTYVYRLTTPKGQLAKQMVVMR
jgi:uncharacterized protein (DUF1501 family)